MSILEKYGYYGWQTKKFMTQEEFDEFFKAHPGIYESIEIVTKEEK